MVPIWSPNGTVHEKPLDPWHVGPNGPESRSHACGIAAVVSFRHKSWLCFVAVLGALGCLARWPKTRGFMDTWLDGPGQSDTLVTGLDGPSYKNPLET
jgi:hypothetical protein